MKNSILFISLLFSFLGCNSDPKKNQNTEKNKFSDAQIRQIYDLADRRKTDSLVILAKQLPLEYHLEIASVLASVQDSISLPILYHFLTSESLEVRKMSAYAIGQIGKTSAQKEIIKLVENEPDVEVKIQLFEALGKSADSIGINYLVSQSYMSEPEKYAQILGFYRALLRGFSHPEAVVKACRFLQAEQSSERVMLKASEFLARNQLENYQQINVKYAIQNPSAYEVIVRHIRESYNPFVRTNLVNALQNHEGKIPQNYTDSLALTLKFDKNEIVRIACVRTLSKGQNVAPILIQALADKSPNVRVVIAQTLVKLEEEIDFVKILKSNNLSFRERAILMTGALKNQPDYAQKIKENYQKSTNIYEKGLLLRALAQNIDNLDFINQELINFKTPVIGTYALEALLKIRQNTDFKENKENLYRFDEIVKFAVQSRDASLGYLIGNELQNPARKYAERLDNLNFIKNAMDSLELPKEQETYIAFRQALDFLETGNITPVPAPKFNHPIAWNFVQQIPKNQQVKITTSKGEIIWDLYVEDAPATVASFLELVDNQFYNNKTFHRIVPNFVAQGGCPRGDGFGSTDYSIRSEFAHLNYQEGTVGMASAGKDTEGCQWFISHIPTPHLDGKYTIFARVKEGMNVVHQLEMGDKIVKIERL